MIISASRRTDIPALYPEWFVNRLKAGEVLVPNPYNRKKIKRIFLSPETVDCIVFWTKNPAPLLPYLREITDMGYEYYFQVTITDYESDMEVNLADTSDVMASFVLMSEKLGRERMDWRFDPLLLTEKYTISYHLEQFELMCRWLAKATTRCIISFVDAYKGSPFRELTEDEILKLAGMELKVLHTPGHTEGGCCYYLEKEKTLFSGDTLFCQSVGRTDFPGGSMSGLVRSIREKLLTLPDDVKVYPGHMDITSIGRERTGNPFL